LAINHFHCRGVSAKITPFSFFLKEEKNENDVIFAETPPQWFSKHPLSPPSQPPTQLSTASTTSALRAQREAGAQVVERSQQPVAAVDLYAFTISTHSAVSPC